MKKLEFPCTSVTFSKMVREYRSVTHRRAVQVNEYFCSSDPKAVSNTEVILIQS